MHGMTMDDCLSQIRIVPFHSSKKTSITEVNGENLWTNLVSPKNEVNRKYHTFTRTLRLMVTHLCPNSHILTFAIVFHKILYGYTSEMNFYSTSFVQQKVFILLGWNVV